MCKNVQSVFLSKQINFSKYSFVHFKVSNKTKTEFDKIVLLHLPFKIVIHPKL